jgi:hypothetical protein
MFKRLFGSQASKLISEMAKLIDDREALKAIDEKLRALGRRASSELAHFALSFDIDQWIREPDPSGVQGKQYRAAQHAMWLVGEIGAPLDDRIVSAFVSKFCERGLRGRAIEENWRGLWSDINQALEKLGQIRLY